MSEVKLSPETIEKLEWLKGRLREYPHRYHQADYCGTQACFIGYILPQAMKIRSITLSKTMATKKLGSVVHAATDSAFEIAEDWLGITELAGLNLFSVWWMGVAKQFNRLHTDTDEQAAEKACQRIDLFIQSGGTQ